MIEGLTEPYIPGEILPNADETERVATQFVDGFAGLYEQFVPDQQEDSPFDTLELLFDLDHTSFLAIVDRRALTINVYADQTHLYHMREDGIVRRWDSRSQPTRDAAPSVERLPETDSLEEVKARIMQRFREENALEQQGLNNRPIGESELTKLLTVLASGRRIVRD